MIGCDDRLRNDLYCVEWGVKLYSIHPPELGGGIIRLRVGVVVGGFGVVAGRCVDVGADDGAAC